MSIYEKTTRDLMHDFAKERIRPSQIFGKLDAVRWFSDHYPKIRSTTVRAHVEGMSINSKSRKHHPQIVPNKGWDLFYQMGNGQYRLWNPSTDGHPIYDDSKTALPISTASEPLEDEDAKMGDDSDKAASEFAFEKDLQNYLVKSLGAIESGLTLYVDEDGAFDGVEYPADGRRIDILAVDKQKRFVVIELKVSKGHEKTIGQLLRYMGWVKKNLADGKDVRGIVVARNLTEDLKLAASMISGVSLIEYEIAFSLKPVQ